MSFILVLALLAPTAGPVSQDMNERALDLYDEGRFAEAAAVFEAIAAQDPKMYFEAGQMRFAAGHMAHASRHFEAYIASGLDDDARYIARTRLAKVALSTRRIEVRLTPVGVDASIVARRLDDPADRTRPELVTPAVAGSASLRLDPGPWELRVEAPGFLALRQVLEVRAVNPTVVLQLVPVPAATLPAQTADRAAPARELRRGRAQTAVGAVMLPLGLVGLGALSPWRSGTAGRATSTAGTATMVTCATTSRRWATSVPGRAGRPGRWLASGWPRWGFWRLAPSGSSVARVPCGAPV